jgi:signal transduction histidine kinase
MNPLRLVPHSVLLGLLGLGLLAVPAAGMEFEHQATRDLVDFVSRAAGLVAKDGAAACDAFKQAGGEWRDGERYVFVLDLEGNAVCHPNPSMEGRNLSEVRDPDGKPIMKLILRQLERGAGEGWVHYLWPRPGKPVLTWKSTYVRQAATPDGGTLVVASGAYGLEMEKAFVVDRVREAAELIQSDGEQAFAVLRDKAGGFLFYDAYVFVMSKDGVMLVNPPSPELEGTSVLEVTDADGVRPGQEMLKVLSQTPEGWVSYLWPRPGDRRAVHKETFVTQVSSGGRELVVGAGIYPAD